MLISPSTSDEYPSCALLYSTVSGSSYGHYICDSTSTAYEVVLTSSDSDASFSLATGSSSEDSTTSSRTRSSHPILSGTDDRFTPTLTSRTTQPTLTSSEAEDSSTSGSTTTPAPETTQDPAVAPPSSTTNAGAMRTAEAVAGALGGAVGMLAWVL